MSILDGLIGFTRILLNGVFVAHERTVNFTGAGVDVTHDPVKKRLDITIPGGLGSVTSDDVSNESGVTGSTVTAALDDLQDQIDGIGPGGSIGGATGSTDNAVLRADGTGGATVQSSLVTISDAGSISLPNGQTVDGRDVSVDGTKLDGIEALADVTDDANVRAALAAATADIAVNNHKITGVADPTSAQHAATKAYVDAAAAAPAYTIEIDANLTTEANQTFANGTQSWLGKTWTGLNISGNVDSFSVVNGTGVVLDHNASNTDWYLTVNTAPRLYLPLSQISSAKLGRSKIRIWMQVTGSGIDANFENAKFGFETIPYASGARRLWTINLDQGGNLGGAVLNNNTDDGGKSAKNSTTARVGMVEMDLRSLDVTFWSKVPTALASDPNSSEFVMSTMDLIATWRAPVGLQQLDNTRAFGASTLDNICAVFGLQTVNTSNTASATWKRLRIEYYNPIPF